MRRLPLEVGAVRAGFGFARSFLGEQRGTLGKFSGALGFRREPVDPVLEMVAVAARVEEDPDPRPEVSKAVNCQGDQPDLDAVPGELARRGFHTPNMPQLQPNLNPELLHFGALQRARQRFTKSYVQSS